MALSQRDITREIVKREKRRKMKEQEKKEVKALVMKREEKEKAESHQEDLEVRMDAQAAEGTRLPVQTAEGTKLPEITGLTQESIENQKERNTSQDPDRVEVPGKKTMEDDITKVHL